MKDIEQASLRADSTISDVRNLFKNSSNYSGMQIEDVVRQVLRLMQHDLQANQISVLTDLNKYFHAIRSSSIAATGLEYCEERD